MGFLYQTCVPIQKTVQILEKGEKTEQELKREGQRLRSLKEAEQRRRDRLQEFGISGNNDETGPPPENRFGQRLVVMESWSPLSLLACCIYGFRRMSVAKWMEEPEETWETWIEDSENCCRFADKWQWIMTSRWDLPWEFEGAIMVSYHVKQQIFGIRKGPIFTPLRVGWPPTPQLF